MSVIIVDYLVYTNEDWRDTLQLTTGEDETPIDLTGCSLRAHVRKTKNTLKKLIDASTLNGRLVIVDAPAGVVAWDVPVAEIELIEPGVYPYDMVLTDADGNVDAFAAGTLTIERGVTR